MPTTSRTRLSEALHDLASTNGVTHFGTLKIGLIGRSRIDIHRDLIRPLREVVRAYGYVRCDLPRRAKLEKSHLPYLIGVIEKRDRSGSYDPHLHYFIRLKHDEEPLYRGFLRSRYGRDCTKGAVALPAHIHLPNTPASMRPYLFPVEVPAFARPTRPLIQRRDATPTFDLQPLTSDWRRATAYIVKQSLSPDIISHLDFL